MTMRDHRGGLVPLRKVSREEYMKKRLAKVSRDESLKKRLAKVSRQEYFKQRVAKKLKRMEDGLEDDEQHVSKATMLAQEELNQQIKQKYQLMIKELETDDESDDEINDYVRPDASYNNFCSRYGALAISS